VEPGRGSRTAERVAERRAAHQVLDDPRVFDDPLALRIIRADAARVLREDPRKYDGSALSGYLRAFVSMRSRFAEDALRDAYNHGVRQYLVLGAGFDTFAYRNPYPDLRVFEIDHPDTQAVKRARLAHAGIAIPPALTLVAADLAEASLAEALAAAGFDAGAPACVAWLGVSMYLSLADVATTLRFIGSLPPRTCVGHD
jgi:methyltransferase (TIGR00027 family)